MFFFSNQSIDNLKLYSISKNQPIRSIRRENMWDFALFDFKKGLPPPSLYHIELGSWSSVCGLGRDSNTSLLGVSTFQTHCVRLKSRNVVFWTDYLMFWVCSAHNSLQIELRTWNLVCRFCICLRCAFWGVLTFQPHYTHSKLQKWSF